MRSAFIQGGDNGGIDVMWSTVDSLAQQYPELARRGVRPRGFMQVDRSYGGDAIIAKNGIERIEDFKTLKEKKIAVSMAASQWLFEHHLASSSLTDDERARIRQSVRLRTEGSAQARDLFINNEVDVAVLWEPDVTAALQMRKNAHALTDTRATPSLIADVMVAREEFIRDHRNVIKAFINGWLEGTTKAINDPMLAVKVLMDWPELGFDRLGEHTTRELLGKTVLTTLEDNAAMFGLSDGYVFFDGLFNRATQIYLKAGYIDHAVAAAQARDATLIQEIYDLDKESADRANCDGNLFTTPLAVSFLPDKANLTQEAMHNLDDPDIGLLLRINSRFRVCVDADTNELDNPQAAKATKQARELTVIRYLVEKHNRPPDQFVSAVAGSSSATEGKVSPYMRLKLVTLKSQSSNHARAVR
jgi:ABC-type nitrate/sulfonate/bicarbonate transport system substrate-binding protein